MARCEADPETECWIYTGAWDQGGAGRMSVCGKTYAVARIAAWIYFPHFDLDGEEVVRHEVCRTPACFNPQHLIRVKDQGVHNRMLMVEYWATTGRTSWGQEAMASQYALSA